MPSLPVSRQPAAPQPHRSARLRPILLPAEHGGWGFLIEPLLFGLIVAFGAASIWLTVATVAAFLARQPAKVILQELRRKRRTQRSRVAGLALLAELLLAAVALALAIRSGGTILLWPLLLAAPLGMLFLYYDMFGPPRSLAAEIAAPAALASVTTAMALADGWRWPFALAFWTVLVCRAVPAVLLVRARLRLTFNRPTSVTWPVVAHLAALLIMAGLVAQNWLPWITLPTYVLLFAHALWMLAPAQAWLRAKDIGFIELGLGIATVLLVGGGTLLMI